MPNSELILTFLKDFREEMIRFRDEVNRRFEQAERERDDIRQELRSEIQNVKETLKDVKEEVKDLKQAFREDHAKLDQVYEARNKVKVTFGWQWGAVSLLIAIVASAITQVFG